MPVSNIADVTTAIIGIISQALDDSGIWTAIQPPVVYPDPVNKKDKEGISVYLYHFVQSPHHKNMSAPGINYPPVKYIPMALNLYYQVTACRMASEAIDAGDAAYDEQLWMTIAIKALRDNPVVLSLGEENQFKITLQAVPATDAVHNWTAGSAALRLSSYYEVSTIFLESEKTSLFSRRVLMYGNYVFAGLAPRITATQSNIAFRLPGEITDRTVKTQPAQASPGSVIIFMGSGINTGDAQLRLFNANWQHPAIASGWTTTVSGDQLMITMGETATVETTGSVVDVLPGLYGAEIIVTKTVIEPDGSTKEINTSSNRTPFLISPSFSVSGQSGTIIFITGYKFTRVQETQIYMGERGLILFEGAGDPDRGQFKVLAENSIQINLPNGLAPGDIALRLIVSGAESAPQWVSI